MEFKKWFVILLILFISLFLAEFLISFTGRFIFSTKAVQDTVSVSVAIVADTSAPTISNALINAASSVALNTIVKVNATVTDNVAISNVTIQVDPPNDNPFNITAPKQSGDEFYNDTVVLSQAGQWIFTFHANDTSRNNATPVVAQDLGGNSFIQVNEAEAEEGAPSIGGGGPSRGGTILKETPIDYDLSTKTRVMASGKQGEIKVFSFDGRVKHMIEFKLVNDRSATLIFKSSYSYEITLSIDDTKEIDLNNDNDNDIKVALSDIKNNVAYLTLEKLLGAELVKEGIPEEPEKPEGPKVEFPKPPFILKLREIQELPFLNMIIVFIILAVLVLIINWFGSKSKNKKHRKKKEKNKRRQQ